MLTCQLCVSGFFQVGKGAMVTHNKFDGIAKCSIQQASEGLSQTFGYLFRSERQDRSQGYNSQEVQGEDGSGIQSLLTGNKTDRNEDQEDVHGT